MFFGNQLRKDGAAHGEAETAADPDQYQNDIDQVNRLRGPPTDGEQKGLAETVSGIATRQQFAAVEEIGGVSGEKEEDEAGRELGQADVSEIERAFGDRIELPSD